MSSWEKNWYTHKLSFDWHEIKNHASSEFMRNLWPKKYAHGPEKAEIWCRDLFFCLLPSNIAIYLLKLKGYCEFWKPVEVGDLTLAHNFILKPLFSLLDQGSWSMHGKVSLWGCFERELDKQRWWLDSWAGHDIQILSSQLGSHWGLAWADTMR